MILFTADWHIKLGQKNVPMPWACSRYELFFQQIEEAVEKQPVIETQADDRAVAESPSKEPEEGKEKGSSDEG